MKKVFFFFYIYTLLDIFIAKYIRYFSIKIKEWCSLLTLMENVKILFF